MANSYLVPWLEKLLADGTILEYAIDTDAIHVNTPDLFYVSFLTPTTAAIDTARTTQLEAARASSFTGEIFESMTESTAHPDYLFKTQLLSRPTAGDRAPSPQNPVHSSRLCLNSRAPVPAWPASPAHTRHRPPGHAHTETPPQQT